jgi:hypothetical protein
MRAFADDPTDGPTDHPMLLDDDACVRADEHAAPGVPAAKLG